LELLERWNVPTPPGSRVRAESEHELNNSW
jgi:hypothetical protein